MPSRPGQPSSTVPHVHQQASGHLSPDRSCCPTCSRLSPCSMTSSPPPVTLSPVLPHGPPQLTGPVRCLKPFPACQAHRNRRSQLGQPLTEARLPWSCPRANPSCQPQPHGPHPACSSPGRPSRSAPPPSPQPGTPRWSRSCFSMRPPQGRPLSPRPFLTCRPPLLRPDWACLALADLVAH